MYKKIVKFVPVRGKGARNSRKKRAGRGKNRSTAYVYRWRH